MSNWYIDAMNLLTYFEKEYDATNFKVNNNIYIWGEIRRYLFFRISANIVERPREQIVKKKDIKKVSNKYALSKLKKVDVLVFEHHRKINIDNEYVDPITYNIEKNFDEKTNIVRVERQDFGGKIFKDFNKNYVHSFEIEDLGLIYKKISQNNEDISFLEPVIEKINQHYGFELTSMEKIKTIINKFLLEYHYYQYCFNRCKPKAIVLPMSYTKTSIILAAKNLGIKTIDIQYAAINKYHIGYYYPYNKEVKYFVDELLVWSDYWKKDFIPKVKFGYTKNRIVDKEKIKKEIDVVYFSQDMLGKDFIEDYEFNYSLNNNIVLKPHPWEKISLEKGNVVKRDDFIDQLDLINKSRIVVTSFSTSIYEGAYLGCNIVIIDNEFKELIDDIEWFNLKKIGEKMGHEYKYFDGSIFYDNIFSKITLKNSITYGNVVISSRDLKFSKIRSNFIKFLKK